MSDPFLGEVRMFAGNFAPVGWVFCNGQLLSIAENDALYTLLGTTFGGDGQNTFGVPDLRGRTPIHQGQGNGLTPRVMGQVFGTETVSLTAAQSPSHTHAVHASSTHGAALTPTNGVWAGSSSGDFLYAKAAPTVTMAASAVSPAGSSMPHENMAPFQAVSFIIATSGIYPPQS